MHTSIMRMDTSLWARGALRKVICSPRRKNLALAAPLVSELGFKQGGLYEEICAKAFSFGLELCPAEVGLALLSQWRNDPWNGWTIIAMSPIVDAYGNRGVFKIERNNNGLCLTDEDAHPRHFLPSKVRLVFALPKQISPQNPK